jgi:hypothetical protein
MPVDTNTYLTTTTGASRNIREDLSAEIFMISPVDTLFTSKIGDVKATGTKH